MSPRVIAPVWLSVAALAWTGPLGGCSRSESPPGGAPSAAAGPKPAPSASASSAEPFPTLDPKTPEELQAVATYTRTARPEHASELRRAAATSEHPIVVGSSLVALARLGALDIDPDFERFLDDPRRRVRNDALVALGMSGHPRAVELLAARLDPEKPQDRAVALGALRRIGSEQARTVIAKALEDPRTTSLDRKVAGVPPK